MATVDYGAGEVEFECTAWTQVVYEQEFCNDPNPNVTGDMTADVMGRLIVSSKDVITVTEDGALEATLDYTRDNRPATMRALWAMMRTSEDIARDEGRKVPHVPSYEEWTKSLLRCEPDMREISLAVGNELQRGLFRAGAAASG